MLTNERFEEVSKDEFFAALYADPRDIMPFFESREYTTWRVVKTRQIWGITRPGWANPSDPKAYTIHRDQPKGATHA